MIKVSKDVTEVHLNLDERLHPETILNDQKKSNLKSSHEYRILCNHKLIG